jgi:hypothetical protein
VATIATIVVGAATPAFGKGAELKKATVDGPGIGEPLRLEAGRLYAANPGQTLFTGSGILKKAAVGHPPPGGLGPRYRVRYYLEAMPEEPSSRPREQVILRQNLYPYAEEGPWTWTPPGQALPNSAHIPERFEKIKAGWRDAPSALLDNLRYYGLPARAEPTTSTSVTRGSSWSWTLWAGVAGVAVLAGLASLRGNRGRGIPVLDWRRADNIKLRGP